MSGKWIESRKRLPEISGKYIAIDARIPNSGQQVGYCAENITWERTMANNESETMFDRFRVTHWMPFAETPKIKGKK